MIRGAEAIIERGVANVRRITEERMAQLGQGEADFVAKNAARTADEPVDTPETRQAVERPFLGDKTEQWFAKMLTGPTGTAVRQRITQGIQQGLTVDDIVRSIRGTKTQRGVLDESVQAVGTLARTAATATSRVTTLMGIRYPPVASWRTPARTGPAAAIR